LIKDIILSHSDKQIAKLARCLYKDFIRDNNNLSGVLTSVVDEIFQLAQYGNHSVKAE